jgi:hypothetical protein
MLKKILMSHPGSNPGVNLLQEPLVVKKKRRLSQQQESQEITRLLKMLNNQVDLKDKYGATRTYD